ncbi:hypothetical protein [Mycobacteroides chelonae]|uniref:hypothetical protein n=1 Tax=Mycobacteroides chelonae TaxID=1774 RepID=UPI001F39B30A|nr:hypothetical protein [Mycobacteroides chelonae]
MTAVHIEKFTLHERLVTHTQPEVAARIAAVLPQTLKSRNCALLSLPTVGPDDFGGIGIRIPLTDQPWADAEICIDVRSRVLGLVGLPSRLPIQDASTLAAALIADESVVLESARRKF